MNNRSGSGGTDGSEVDAALTPAMRQYRAAKEMYPDTLLFFRMGDFYELFFEDAIVASRELQLTLTARDKAKSVPMCGVPYHAAEGYLHRLLRRGFRVAVCEQMEDPKLAKGVVKREVTRVLTPGTAVDPGLEGGQSCWLAAIGCTGRKENVCYGLALIDLSTGEMRTSEFAGADAWQRLLSEVGRMRPVELVYSDELMGGDGAVSGSRGGAMRLKLGEVEGETGEGASELEAIRTKTAIEGWVFHPEYAVPLLLRQMKLHALDGVGLQHHPAAVGAAAALLEYLQRTKQGALEHVDSVRFYGAAEGLELDAGTVRHLELVDPLMAGYGPQNTLLWTVDRCMTAMGKRLLRSTLLRPASGVGEIDGRLDAVEELTASLQARELVRGSMDGLLDLERLLGRVALNTAGPRDVQALRKTVDRLPGVRSSIAGLGAARWGVLARDFDAMEELAEELTRSLEEDPPVTLNDGGVVREGVSAELDELRALGQNGRSAVAAIEERERARTGIASLKVRFNQVFGYYLEVTRANAAAVPADYERKQTLVNAERYTTPELKVLEEKILHAQERAGVLERQIFAGLRELVLRAAGRVRATARRVAEIDLLANFAHVAVERGWTRPRIEQDTAVLEVLAGRHPVVEQRMEETGGGRFVPNGLHLDATEGSVGPMVALITGPNMGGKSTYLRMAALLVILAQSGSFVPAERMRFGVVDRVFTRIGASDNVARGRSTFMVEMIETAAILNQATNRSLLLLDEMGRGTATYDGLSLAWSTLEYLHDVIGARALFATHYHELTMLAERLRRLVNLRVTVREAAGGIVFLHGVEAGSASKSYGIEVARLAGLPRSVVERAREVLRQHERMETEAMRGEVKTTAAREVPAQLTIFTPLSQRVVDRIGAIDVDSMTPREALNLLAELQRELAASAS